MAIFLDELNNMTIYKKPFYFPINEDDKKSGSAIFLLTKSQESSEKLMNLPYAINQRLFQSYFTDKDITHIISKDGTINNNDSLMNESLSYEDYCSSINTVPTPTPLGGYDINGKWNSLLVLDNKNYRERCEALIFHNDSIYMVISKNGETYRLPGGGTELYCTIEEQVKNECEEEARITIDEVSFIGTYKTEFKNREPFDIGLDFIYDGSVTHLFTAKYDSNYTGFIDDLDKDDNMYNYGHFYKISEVYHMLKPIHKMAVDMYLEK